ncbi:MAG: ribosome recycling factor [Acholeplasmatales bacterium]|nr:ribosome recycling factor [Acholeplasmatales bacterium]
MSDLADMLLLEHEEKMNKALDSCHHELNTVRTGRANPNILDSIYVDYYGAKTQLRQLSAITSPEANQLYIKPFDKTSLKAIMEAISASSLGLTPQNDGNGIRLVFPQMTEDRRKQLVKEVAKYGEAGKVQVRNVRRDANDALKKLELPEDEEKGYLEDIQALTDKFIKKVDEAVEAKSKELMTI